MDVFLSSVLFLLVSVKGDFQPLDIAICIPSNQDPQFTRWHEMHKILRCKPRHTVAYRPQCNGMVERFHRSLKAALKSRLLGPCWMDELPVVLLGIRSTWKEYLEATPVLQTYGNNPKNSW